MANMAVVDKSFFIIIIVDSVCADRAAFLCYFAIWCKIIEKKRNNITISKKYKLFLQRENDKQNKNKW